MMEYGVEIRETLTRTIYVRAETMAEAEQRVEQGWNQGDYVLDADDFSEVHYVTISQEPVLENYMSYEEFVDEIADLMQSAPDYLGDSYSILTVNAHSRRQGDFYGIGIRLLNDGNSAPVGFTLNLHDQYNLYYRGEINIEEATQNAFNEVLDAIDQVPQLSAYHLNTYDVLKQDMRVELMPIQGHEEFLKDIPHREIYDMAMVYRFMLENGRSSMLATNWVLKDFNITAEQLHEDAMAASAEQHPLRIHDYSLDEYNVQSHFLDTSGWRGAGAIFYPNSMEQVAKELGESFYIIPYDINGIFAIKESANITLREIQKLAAEIYNKVADDYKLSSQVYHYDTEVEKFELASEYKERTATPIEPLMETYMVDDAYVLGLVSMDDGVDYYCYDPYAQDAYTGTLEWDVVNEQPQYTLAARARIAAVNEIGLAGTKVAKISPKSIEDLRKGRRMYGKMSWKNPELEKTKSIRFITSEYKTLFYIPDGGNITIDFTDHTSIYPCRYIDECHLYIGSDVFHICEFAERMERSYGTVKPEPIIMDEECAWVVGRNHYLAIQKTDEGYDYTLYNHEFVEMDGGVYDNPDITMNEARDAILEDNNLRDYRLMTTDYDELKEMGHPAPSVQQEQEQTQRSSSGMEL
jgi:hypothetical protein